ncbi:MAG: hypothetical protein EOP09_10005, partial [Proteobacteria bacterium]
MKRSLCTARAVLLWVTLTSSGWAANFTRSTPVPLDRPTSSRAFSLSSSASSVSDPKLAKRAWMERASRILRNGQSLSPRDPLSRWDSMSEDALLEEWFKEPTFENSLLQFSFAYFGVRSNTLINPDAGSDGYVDSITQLPAALHSVQNYLKGEDYFTTLIALQAPFYLRPLAKKLSDKVQMPGESVETARTRKILEVRGWFTLWRNSAADPQATTEQYCNTVMGFGTGMFDILFNLGIETTDSDNYFTYSFLLNPIQNACRGSIPAGFDRIAETEKAIAGFSWLLDQLPALEPSRYVLRSIADIKTMDYRSVGGPEQQFAFTTDFEIIQDKGNSSTNYNRKRAAYVLKTYFCDDLTPIGVVLPGAHATGRHGSDPSCMACHYKLDPMAGFFRNYGRWFFDYKNLDTLVFTDGAKTSMTAYDAEWKAPAGSGRNYDVGYVRSTTRPS